MSVIRFNATSKTKSWREDIARMIVQGAGSDEKTKDLLCQRYFEGDINQKDYDYLRKVGEYELPAKVRFIPIVRQNINNLISQEARRGFNFKPYVVDPESLEKKLTNRVQDIIRVVDSQIDAKYNQYQATMQQLDLKKQQVDGIIAQQPQSAEEQQKIEAMKELYPSIISEIQNNKHALERETFITKETLDKVEEYYQKNPTDIVESRSSKILKYAIYDSDIGMRKQINRAFQDRLVNGKELYYVDILPDHKFPIFKRIHSYNAYWSGDGDNEWIQDGQWVALHFKMSPTNVVDWLGDELGPDEIKNLDNYINLVSYNDLTQNYQSGRVYTEKSNDLYGGTRITRGIDIWNVIWKASRKIKIKFTPHPYLPGKFFKHFYDEDVDVSFDPAKGEFLKTRYIDDLYEAVIIGNKKVVKSGKRKYQLRNPDTLRVSLPVIGESFNGIDKPYSLIWDTKDIQELVNLLHYHRELMFALSGVKGIVMDYAQKPDEFTEKEWLYYRKQGLTLIDSMKKKNGRFASFNQFQTYDDTISSSIQYIDIMIASLQRLVDDITGVSYQRKGMTVSTDQVGTTNVAINQSTLTTEVLYYYHDETTRRALETWLNLSKISMKEGGVLSYYEGSQLEIVDIPSLLFENAIFKIGVIASSKDEQDILNLKQISTQGYASGRIALDELIKIYKTDNLVELQNKIELYAKKAAENAQLYEKDKMQAELDAKKQEIQFSQEFDKIIADQENQLKAADIKVKEMETAIKERDQQLNEYVEKRKLDLEGLKIATEQQSEMGYLAEQTRASKTEEMLKAIQIQLDAYFNGKKIDADLQVKKASISQYKAPKAGVEQIKR